MMKKIIAFLALSIMVSCDLFNYHQLDGNSHLKKDGSQNERNISMARLLSQTHDNFRFIFMGDTHRNDKETEAFVNHVNQSNGAQFVLHAGDITDFGYPKEYRWTDKILKKLTIPHIVLIGNHDIPGYGDLVYEDYYGPLNFMFTIGEYMFIAINTNRMEYKSPQGVPDFEFLDQAISETPNHKGTIVVMHAPPNGDQLNDEKIVQQLTERLCKIPNLLVCLHGHTHRHEVHQPIGNDITFIGCDNIAKRTYMVFDLSDEGYKYEMVNF